MLHEATRLLRCFNAEAPLLSRADMAARIGADRASSDSLIDAMAIAGLLQRESDLDRYRPGPLALDLAAAYRAASTLITLGIDAVNASSRQSGHTGFVTVLDGADATAAFALPGTAPNHLPPRVSRMPACRSASGRTLLARLSDDEIRDRHRAHDRGAVDALIARLDVLRDEGYEISRSEQRKGVESLAVAVASPANGEAISLCIKYPADGLLRGERSAIIESLIAGAERIAAQVGDIGFTARAGIAAARA